MRETDHPSTQVTEAEKRGDQDVEAGACWGLSGLLG